MVQAHRRGLNWSRRVLFGAALLAAGCLQASAQPHQKRLGDYLIRSSVVDTGMLPEATARAHGIEPAPGRAVLNVVVLHREGESESNTRARITATAADLNGRRRTIDLRKVVANEMVSYIGSFGFLSREVLDFRVTAIPEASAPDQPAPPKLTLSFRERMWFY